MKSAPKFYWNKHGLLLFVAVTFGVSLSYLGLSYFNHQTRAAALPLLQYLSPDRIESPPKYPICPHLVDATIPGSSVTAYQDLCTGLYWATNDTGKTTIGSLTIAGTSWQNAEASCPQSPVKFALPTADQLLTLSYIPCGEIRYCENSGTAPIFCSADRDCPQVKAKYCSDAKTISCNTESDCVKLGAGTCESPTTDTHYSCVADACSPIARKFGSYQGTVAPLLNSGTNKLKINADGSYWTRQEVDGLQGKQCSTNPSVSCTTDASCRGTCGNVVAATGFGTCSNSSDIKCDEDTDCSIGSCELNESAVSVNLKYGTVNNPIMGKNTLLNVRCVYEPPQ